MKKSFISMFLLACLAVLSGAVMAMATEAVSVASPAASAVMDGSVLDIILANSGVILAALLAVSEALALIPSIKANSIFQLLVNGLKSMAGKK